MNRTYRKLMLALTLGCVLLLGGWSQAQAYDPPALVRALNVPARVYYRTVPPWMWYNPYFTPYYSPWYPLAPYPYAANPVNPAYAGSSAATAGSLPSLPPLPAIPPVPPVPPIPGGVQ